MPNIFDSLVKSAGNEYSAKVSDGLESDTTTFIDTGSYSLNALISGSIYGGLPSNKVVALAGEESTGKTFYALSIVKNFLVENKDGACIYFESEGSLTTQILEQKGIDTKRFYIMPVVTIQEFRTQALKVVNDYLALPADERKPLFFVLDSLGNCSTTKEVEDIAAGKDTRDMTRSQLVRGAFRVLTLKLNRAMIPMLITNHTYDVIGAYVPTKEMCLVGDTSILMGDGSFQTINNIKVGQQVMTAHGKRHVTDTHQYNDVELFKLTMEDGSTVTCTGEHKFLVNGEWRTVYSMLDEVSNTEHLNTLDLADIKGDLRGLHEALQKADGTGETQNAA